MKQTNLSIFVPHVGCPHRCSFCDQRSISGTQKPPRAADVEELLTTQAEHLTASGIKAEIAFFGGSFTAIERGYMLELLEAAKAAVERFSCYNGIRCSTRPDCISPQIISVLKAYGVTFVELGAQSMSDEVLQANERGHSAQDVRNAAQLIRESGIGLGLQMMTGLYKDSESAVLDTAREFIALKADAVRVYPTVILKGTRLGELYESGEYRTFSFEMTVDLCAKLLRMFDAAGIPVIRMGLHASKDVERDMLGGVYHPALSEIVQSRIFLDDMRQALCQMPQGEYVIYTDPRNISKAVGQKRSSIITLAGEGYSVSVKPRQGAYIEVQRVCLE